MKIVAICALFSMAIIIVFLLLPNDSSLKQVSTWQATVSPGDLSRAHAHLENDCAACHTPVRGVKPENCTVCHANNHELLTRQPTAFHANINDCASCHLEHQGIQKRPINMEHATLANIGLRQLLREPNDSAGKLLALELHSWVKRADTHEQMIDSHPNIGPSEKILNCASCHTNEDVHTSYFGNDCAACHSTKKWSIANYKHPSIASTSCNQCHQGPPSHYMMHFQMISAKVAEQPHAKVEQCHLCHQTTSWNDIKRVGMYKHH